MNLDIAYRTAPIKSDIGRIATMVKETAFFRSDEEAVALEVLEERLKKGIASGYHFLFAENNGEVVAYTCFGQIPCSLLSWDLYWIVTARRLQGKGIGKGILRETERRIERAGGKNVVIETSSKDLYRATRDFYRHNGYKPEARLKDFYDHGDDKLIYIKRL